MMNVSPTMRMRREPYLALAARVRSSTSAASVRLASATATPSAPESRGAPDARTKTGLADATVGGSRCLAGAAAHEQERREPMAHQGCFLSSFEFESRFSCARHSLRERETSRLGSSVVASSSAWMQLRHSIRR
jgi:hypothetical protein